MELDSNIIVDGRKMSQGQRKLELLELGQSEPRRLDDEGNIIWDTYTLEDFSSYQAEHDYE